MQDLEVEMEMISTLMTSRASPSNSSIANDTPHASPNSLLAYYAENNELQNFSLEGPLLSQYFLQDQGSEIPNPGTILRNFVSRQIPEIRDAAEGTVPKLCQLQELKKNFREFYSKYAIHCFEYLDSPLTPNLEQAEIIVKRFGRSDYNANRVKIRDLLLDLDCSDIVEQLNSQIQVSSQPSGMFEWLHLTKSILGSWKAACAELANAEKRLNNQIALFQDTFKKAQTILTMPEVDAYRGILKSMEDYLKAVFDAHNIEKIYAEYKYALKKVAVLADAISYVRVFANSSVEPVCSVCFSEPVSMASIPCGHTFCQQCANRQSITCYICRASVKDKIKVYFS